ncbi:MAG: enoyl-CoA hydratase/isomerase [Chromatiales bacterium]|jgi:2-(1,2-epoxy-1,2-dihydrophenyl)acetyl-CoA isomerase|nr:enoyl-CoA hydratase/isomerase [Chromatiales bacterium]
MRHGVVTLDVNEDGIGVLTLNDPSSLNAWGEKMKADFAEAIDKVEDPASGIRCVVITGAGRAFSSGANLNDPDAPPRDREAEARGEVPTSLEAYYHPMLLRLRELSVPLVAAVNGVAAGVGMSFALSTDLVVMSKSAYFLQAFARIGLVPDGGSTYILPRLIGAKRAVELSLLADKLPAEKALEWGLVNRVVEDNRLMDEALALAKRLATGPMSLGLIRKMYWQSLDNDYPTQLALESKLQTDAGQSRDHDEGVTAFREKRVAQFEGH